MPAVHKTAISRKTKFFGTFCPFFRDSMNVWHYPSNYSKIFLSHRLQRNVSVEQHMIQMMKQFSLQLGEAGAALQSFIELSELNQTFGKTKDFFRSPVHVKQVEKKHAT